MEMTAPPDGVVDIRCFNKTLSITNGFFFNETTTDYFIRIFPLQVSVISLIQATLLFLLKPFGETPVVTQILGGILVGPAGLARNDLFRRTLFPLKGGTLIPETFGWFGCMIYFFLIGVKLDLRIITRLSKKEWVIGICCAIFPLAITMPVALHIKNFLTLDDLQHLPITSFPIMAIFESSTSFHVVSCFLADLNILNTELGRLATSVSTVTGIISWIAVVISFSIKQQFETEKSHSIQFLFSILAQIIFITMLLRKIVIWMIKQTPPGEPVKEIYIFLIILMICVTGLIGQVLGPDCLFGPIILGLSIPDGPPVGSTLTEKLDPIISALFLPLFFFSNGFQIDVKSDFGPPLKLVAILLSLGFCAKLMGTIISCLFFKVPFTDALMLGLIMNTLGVFDITSYATALTRQYIDPGCFSMLVLSTVFVAGIISPIVHFCYNPSRGYIVHKKRAIQNAKQNADFRILVCIYNQIVVPTAIGILQASNPTRESPIVVYLVHLVELVGRSAPLLISHKTQKRRFDESSPSDPIFNVFKIFEKQNPGIVDVQPYTAITPFVSAHDDICTIALEKKTSLVIIPFHKQWNIDGTIQTCKWENANKKVLKHAPCSVGILIHREDLNGGSKSVISEWSTYNVGIIFLGGDDDREATFYALRMSGHPHVNLSMHQIIVSDHITDDVTEKMIDSDVINEYRLDSKHVYKENFVKDGVEIVGALRSMENAYDLILVGRRHTNYSKLLSGLTEWSEFPELGFFGDLLVSSDFHGIASVLVVQQHSCVKTTIE